MIGLVSLLALTGAFVLAPGPVVIDDFESIAAWSAHPSEGVTMKLRSAPGVRGRALRIDYDFHGGGGYALVRRAVTLDLPPRYSFTWYLRGASAVNNLEFKLIDSTNDNVWWSNQRDYEFPTRWSKITRRKRHIEFAWGPVGGGEIRHVAAIEIAITAGRGGRGTVWLDELTLTPLDSASGPPPVSLASASSASEDHAASLALDGDGATAWESATSDPTTLTVDFTRPREIGGLTIDWRPGAQALDYAVELSDDSSAWTTAYDATGANGGRDYIYLPETETRFVRLRLRRGVGDRYAIRELTVHPVEWSATRNAFLASVARDAPRGDFPRYLEQQQVYWTVAGVSGDTRQALVSEDGAVEPFAFEWSLEPFLRIGDSLVTWAAATRAPSLEHGSLPIPTVEWTGDSTTLAITAFATGAPGRSSLFVRYRVRGTAGRATRATLYVALRSFQVNPPWQFLNGTGGAARVRRVAYSDGVLRVQGADSERVVVPLTRPSAVSAATFDNGGVAELLRANALPARRSATDPLGLASAVLAFDVDLGARGGRDVYLQIPLHPATPLRRAGSDDAAIAVAERELATAVRTWESALGIVDLELPPTARRVAESIRSNLAWMLLERRGPALRPGTRSYARSWIRDGALMAAALGRLGHDDAVRRFIDWYLPYQRPDGRVPCCVDARGADPVAEHDSHGELIYLVAEYWRLTGDSGLVARMWPHIALAVGYIDSLRHTRMTPAFRADSGGMFYGLLPPSISHEGYSAKPMHSYWDDFFALKGLTDAADLAAMLGRDEEARRIGALRDEFRTDLLASIRASMTRHGVDYIPGSADLGDFDATSTTIAIAPVGARASLPENALLRTFERYYENFRARRDGAVSSADYTPYEMRAIGTFVRLGWRDRAQELLEFFLADQRPAPWRQWAEVVYKDPLTPKFIGDMPHAWVGSDFVRSMLDVFAYERASDSALVIAAGVPAAWVRDEPGIRIRALRTYYGMLTYTMRETGDTLAVRFAPGILRMPAGGIVVVSPDRRPVKRAVADGEVLTLATPDRLRLRRVPRRLDLYY